MASLRAMGAALGAAVAIAGVLASSAAAVPIRPATDQTLTTTHFVIHYWTSAGSLDYTSETQAGDFAAYAERAYALETGWGYPAPVDDGDGHIDIYIQDLSVSDPGVIGYVVPDSATAPTSGLIVLTSPADMVGFAKAEGLTVEQEEAKTVAHELFHLFQFATWLPANQSDDWLLEGSAQWAGFNAIGYPPESVITTVGPADIALSCRDDLASPRQMCDPDPYKEGGYSRWAFFQMLANEYGNAFLHDVLVNGAAGQSAVTALSNALAAKGSSLASQFNDYAKRLMDADFGVPALSAVRPTAEDSVLTGLKTGALPAFKVPVNHLAARYVTFERGDGDGSHACYAATLSINVAIPAGTSSQPYFYWDAAGSTPQALTVSGSNASITVPWDTCNWGGAGWLSLPNAGTTVDAADFVVTSSVTVDTSTPASSSTAPLPATIWGTTVPVPATDIAPLIDVFGPELLKVDSKSPTIRLIVESSGPGSVNATLGSVTLGGGTLRAGENDLRFTVPKGMLSSLRRSASATSVLTLTPVSPGGTSLGTPVTRHVVVTVAKAKPKPKAHPKKK